MGLHNGLLQDHHENRTQQSRNRNRYHPGVHNVPEQVPVDGPFLWPAGRIFLGRVLVRRCVADEHDRTDFAVRRRYRQPDFAGQQHSHGSADLDCETAEKYERTG